jgi:hypothetical protein
MKTWHFYFYEGVVALLIVWSLAGLIFRLPLRMPGGQILRGASANMVYVIIIIVAAISGYAVWQASPVAGG